jgi:DNA mismatch repair protein MutS
LTEDTLLDARRHNYLAAVAPAGAELALAWLDISTGDLACAATDPRALATELARLDPGEIVLPDSLLSRAETAQALEDWTSRLSPLPSARFDSQSGARRLKAAYRVEALDAFGDFTRAELAAAGALIDYVETTQKGRVPALKPPVRQHQGATMAIDAATRRNLELTRTLAGERELSLLTTIDRTVTGAGARLLASWLAAPLTDAAAIGRRHDMVASFIDGGDERARLRELLKAAPDLARALSRLTLGRGGPRDLAAVRDGLRQAGAARRLLSANDDDGMLVPGLRDCLHGLGDHGPMVDALDAALAAELPVLTRDGGFIAEGYRSELDEFRTLRDESRRHIAALQKSLAAETGITSLKIRHNNLLGYYIEIPAQHASKMGDAFIHRQTMANAMRFSSVPLGELQGKIAEAGDRALALEMSIFDELVTRIEAAAGEIAEAAGALATLDVVAGLAELAVSRRYVRPTVDDSTAFRIAGGRHPVVEHALEGARDGTFVPNDCDLEEAQRLWLLTGPNMAGKSTFLRQNALIAVLAQMGSFVPADEAHIGVVDRLFSRVGAADDLARGRSTFMVEMVESAAILNQAGPRALVILDEIGRGTATFDGLSIAWAVIEHLHEVNRCRALFATHYHELTALAAKLPALANRTIRIKEWEGEVVFLHEVAAGAADRSYGIQVAKLAGLPAAVVARAEQVLESLEEGEQAGAVAKLADDLPLFANAPEPAPTERVEAPSAVEAALSSVLPDQLTPRQALDLVYQLRELLADQETDR